MIAKRYEKGNKLRTGAGSWFETCDAGFGQAIFEKVQDFVYHLLASIPFVPHCLFSLNEACSESLLQTLAR
jgi:hypothetical protein